MIAAVVPAAGRSERMRRPKLLLPVGGTSLICRVVEALRAGGADLVVVVVAPPEQEGAAELAEQAKRAGASVVVAPTPPADMRASVALGLDHLEQGPPPDTVLLSPGDQPGVTASLVERIVRESRRRPACIVLPTFAGKRGHPVALPWRVAREVHDLPEDLGVNAVVARHAAEVVELAVEERRTIADLDTPEDYQYWLEREANGGDRTGRGGGVEP